MTQAPLPGTFFSRPPPAEAAAGTWCGVTPLLPSARPRGGSGPAAGGLRTGAPGREGRLRVSRGQLTASPCTPRSSRRNSQARPRPSPRVTLTPIPGRAPLPPAGCRELRSGGVCSWPAAGFTAESSEDTPASALMEAPAQLQRALCSLPP